MERELTPSRSGFEIVRDGLATVVGGLLARPVVMLAWAAALAAGLAMTTSVLWAASDRIGGFRWTVITAAGGFGATTQLCLLASAALVLVDRLVDRNPFRGERTLLGALALAGMAGAFANLMAMLATVSQSPGPNTTFDTSSLAASRTATVLASLGPVAVAVVTTLLALGMAFDSLAPRSGRAVHGYAAPVFPQFSIPASVGDPGGFAVLVGAAFMVVAAAIEAVTYRPLVLQGNEFQFGPGGVVSTLQTEAISFTERLSRFTVSGADLAVALTLLLGAGLLAMSTTGDEEPDSPSRRRQAALGLAAVLGAVVVLANGAMAVQVARDADTAVGFVGPNRAAALLRLAAPVVLSLGVLAFAAARLSWAPLDAEEPPDDV